MSANTERPVVEGAGASLDLSMLAGDEKGKIQSVSLRTVTQVLYVLSPLEETDLYPSGIIEPVHLEVRADPRVDWERIEDGLVGYIQEAGLAIEFFKTWASERRHFPKHGETSIVDAAVHRGDIVTINDRETSPIDSIQVATYVDEGSSLPLGLRSLPNSGLDPETGRNRYWETRAVF